MKKLARRLQWIGTVLLVALALAAMGMYWASRQVPEFYEQKLAAPPQVPAGADLEQQALSLHNQLQHTGRWEARFTEEQINAWLASDLPEKLPTLLPPAISEPRIALEDKRVRLAARYRRGNVDTVISLSGDAYLTDQPNEIAIRIEQARAGYLPLPLGQLLGEIRTRAERAEISLRWTEIAGEPVALVRVPGERASESCDDGEPERLVLEEVALKAGEVVVAGRIENGPAAHAASAPAGDLQEDNSETRQR